jgi:uncharacterized protein
MKSLHNQFVWHDLLTSDVASATVFYSHVVGWDFSEDATGYQTSKAEGCEMGGVMKAPDYLQKMPPFWSGYIYTPDVDAACVEVEKRGGLIFREPWGIAGVLRMAVIADPTGGFFNIMQSLAKVDAPLPPEGALGTVGWNELHTEDPDEAWDFYAGMFGWTKGETMDLGAHGVSQVFQIKGRDAGAMMQKRDSMPRPMWLYYFRVDGMAAAAARIVSGGGKITLGPAQILGGQWALSATDTEGGSFQLLSASL